MDFRILPLAIVTLGLLAGCGGSNVGALPGAVAPGTAATVATKTPTTPTFDELARQNALQQEFARTYATRVGANKPNYVSNIPITGNGAYNGVIAIAADGIFASGGATRAFTPDAADLIADMALNVDFSTTKVTASLWDFIDEDGFKQGGSVQMQGLQKGNEIAVAGTGDLFAPDGTASELEVEITGKFYTPKSENIFGNVKATRTRNGVAETMTGEAALAGATY